MARVLGCPPEQAVVIDCSVFASHLIDDEIHHAKAQQAMQSVKEQRLYIYQPAIFILEIENVLLRALRKERISSDVYGTTLRLLTQRDHAYNMVVYSRVDEDQALVRARGIAQKHSLTLYDACYLELAEFLKIRLLTFDEALARAAQADKRLWAA